MFTFIAGYVLVWLSLAGYVGWLAHRQRRLGRQLARLEEQLARTADHEPARQSKAA